MRFTRRYFLSSAAAAAACFASPSLFSQEEAQQPETVLKARAGATNAKITTQRLRGNLSVLQGSGGNIAALSGPQGKVLVDAGISTSQPHIQEAPTAISADPIQHLINTHWHYDHTDGNLWMHEAGATIVAHEKTRQRLNSPQTIELFHAIFPARPAEALPTILFTDQHVLKINGTTLHLEHYDPAHTDTDISVYFADADVLHTGDTWFNGVYPFIDYSTGGHIDGMIRATKRSLAMGTTSTIVIPGHGPVGNKQQVAESLEMLSAVRDKVSDLKKLGKSIDETIAAKPTAAFDEKWGKGFTTPEMFTRFVYQGV